MSSKSTITPIITDVIITDKSTIKCVATDACLPVGRACVLDAKGMVQISTEEVHIVVELGRHLLFFSSILADVLQFVGRVEPP